MLKRDSHRTYYNIKEHIEIDRLMYIYIITKETDHRLNLKIVSKGRFPLQFDVVLQNRGELLTYPLTEQHIEGIFVAYNM